MPHDHEEVQPDTNAGERGVHPPVLIRKNSYANGSEKGAHTQATFMTILRTLKTVSYTHLTLPTICSV